MPGAQDEGSITDNEAWTLFDDGSWGTFNIGVAAILISPSTIKTCYVTRLEFNYTNNIAEYEALLLGLRTLKTMGIRRAVLKFDS
jgi:ribonuclease HI